MQANMINTTLLRGYNAIRGNFGVTLAELAGRREWNNCGELYFFLRKELNVTRDNWTTMKNRGEIRHCKIYRGRFLDYVVQQEFDTLEAWATHAGGRLEDVLYGENRVRDRTWVRNEHDQLVRVYKTPMYVELSVLLRHLGYVPPPPLEVPREQDVDLLTQQMDRLMIRHGLSVDNVWVFENNIPVKWTEFMKED